MSGGHPPPTFCVSTGANKPPRFLTESGSRLSASTTGSDTPTLHRRASEHGAAIVGMPIGHIHGMPKTVEGRLAESRVIVEAAERHGIPRDDIVIDAICLASSAEPGSMQVTLDTLSALHQELGVATILGIGNAGFGMPDQTCIDLGYLLAAIPWGLDAALVDPATLGLIEGTRAVDFLTGRDLYGKRYIQHYRAKKRDALE